MVKRLLILPLLFAVLDARADGTSIGGGGTSCGGRFLDNMFRTGKYLPKEDPAYKKVVEPALFHIRECLPFFADDLEMALSKPWYKVKCPLSQEHDGASHYSTDQLAYQDRVATFIDDTLLSQASDEDRGTMILHEMIQGVRIQKLLLNMPGEPNVEVSAVGVLNDKLLENPQQTCGEMQENVRKYLLTAYATQKQIDRFGLPTLAKKRAEVRDSCSRGLAPDLLGGNYAPQRFFDKLGPSPGDVFMQTWGCHYLHVPLDEKYLKYDAQIRIKAKIHVRHSGEGFYTDPVALKSTAQVCDELGVPLMVQNPAACMSCPAPKMIPVHDPDSEPTAAGAAKKASIEAP